MKEKYENFIGIYDESVPVELCNRFVENYEEAKKNRTIIDLTKENESSHREISHQLMKKDEVAYITPLISTMCPIPPTKEYFNFLTKSSLDPMPYFLFKKFTLNLIILQNISFISFGY